MPFPIDFRCKLIIDCYILFQEIEYKRIWLRHRVRLVDHAVIRGLYEDILLESNVVPDTSAEKQSEGPSEDTAGGRYLVDIGYHYFH